MQNAGRALISTHDPLNRRSGRERRKRTLHGLLAGHWLRRRREGRRGTENAAMLDWHSAHRLGVAILVLLLSVGDAFMTLTLMRHGANEANPLMAPLIEGGGPGFAYWKLGLTAFGVVVLTALARVRLLGVIPAACLLYLVLFGYVGLIAYEWHLLHRYGTDVVSSWGVVPLH